MHDQPIQRDPVEEYDRIERQVLDLLLDPDAPGPWSVHEVGVALRNKARAEDARTVSPRRLAPKAFRGDFKWPEAGPTCSFGRPSRARRPSR